MNLLCWMATTLSALMLTWLTASAGAPGGPASPSSRLPSEAVLLGRVEREVTTWLRERHTDRWRFSRVHRPTPAYRTVPDPEAGDARYAAFRVVALLRSVERPAWHVRVERTTGAIELAAAQPPDAPGVPAWQPLASVLRDRP